MKKTFEILNGFNIIDNLNIKEYNNMKQDYMALCMKKSCETLTRDKWNEELGIMETENIRNENYKEIPKRVQYAIDQVMDEMTWAGDGRWTKDWNARLCYHAGGDQVIYDYLEIIPFTPSVMINISPDWKSGSNQSKAWTIETKGKRLETLLKKYLEESQRYDYYNYVIENGADGEHVHAHIVAHINPKISKSVNTHLSKGNHTQQLKKYAKGIKGIEGTIKGAGITKTFLRNKDLVKDKLDYLIEDLKPEGHKNKSIMWGGEVVLFTVK